MRRFILTKIEWQMLILVMIIVLPSWFFILDIFNTPHSIKPTYDTYQSIPRHSNVDNTINYYNVAIPDSFKVTFGNDLNLNEYQRN